MIPLIILAGAAVIGVGLAAKFWKSIKEWIEKAAQKIKQLVDGVVYGFRVFGRKMQETYEEISKFYSQDKQGQWEETISRRTVSASEVPKEILEKALENQEQDITEELELSLSN